MREGLELRLRKDLIPRAAVRLVYTYGRMTSNAKQPEKMKTLHVAIPATLLQAVNVKAVERETTVKQFVTETLEAAVVKKAAKR